MVSYIQCLPNLCMLKNPSLASVVADLDEFRFLPNWRQVCPTIKDDPRSDGIARAPGDLQTVGLRGWQNNIKELEMYSKDSMPVA